MTNAIPAIALLAAMVSSCLAQEIKHAPTAKQCRADQRLWLSKLESVNDASIGYEELNAWRSEMRDCMTVDPAHQDQYYNTIGETLSAVLSRVVNFLDRHNLYNQFKAEDAQGKR